MKLDAEWLTRLNSGEDADQVMHEYLEDQGPGDYVTYLQHLCEMAGWPDENTDPQFTVESAIISGNECHVLVEAYFDEKVFGGGCPDMPTIEPRSAEAEFWVDLKTGDVRWRSDYSNS
jgi:hypothetical protein